MNVQIQIWPFVWQNNWIVIKQQKLKADKTGSLYVTYLVLYYDVCCGIQRDHSVVVHTSQYLSADESQADLLKLTLLSWEKIVVWEMPSNFNQQPMSMWVSRLHEF